MKLLSYLYKKFETAYDTKVSSTGLAIFRICWGIVLFLEVSQMRHFKELRFDTIPFIDRSELNFGPVLLVWQILIIMLILGWKTRTVTVVNYILSILFFGCITSFEYHIFYIYLSINFLLIIIPTQLSLSIDNLLKHVRYNSVNYTYFNDQRVSILYYLFPVLIGIAFVYFDSSLHKFGSTTWRSGLGLWRPGVMPNMNLQPNFFALNHEYLMFFMGYLTFVFEIVFIFFMWFKKFRIPLFIIGFGLHLGIYVLFPIPFFALGFIAIYLLILPPVLWDLILKKIKLRRQQISFIFDSSCPICIKTQVLLKSLDILGAVEFISVNNAQHKYKTIKNIDFKNLIDNIHGISKTGKVYQGIEVYRVTFLRILPLVPIGLILSIPPFKQMGSYIYNFLSKNRIRQLCNEDNCITEFYPIIDDEKKLFPFISLKKWKIAKLLFIFIFFILIQLNSSLNAPIITSTINKTGIYKTSLGSYLHSKSTRINELTAVFLGVKAHGLFGDGHYAGFRDIFAISYIQGNKEKWLPIINKNGNPDTYNTGGNFAKWTFRVNTPMYNRQKLQDGIKIYTAFWLGENNIPVEGATFIIKHKPVYSPSEFIPNQLEVLEAIPWTNVGTCIWHNELPVFKINEEEITKHYSD